jgi:hypothetical protein
MTSPSTNTAFSIVVDLSEQETTGIRISDCVFTIACILNDPPLISVSLPFSGSTNTCFSIVVALSIDTPAGTSIPQDSQAWEQFRRESPNLLAIVPASSATANSSIEFLARTQAQAMFMAGCIGLKEGNSRQTTNCLCLT